MQKPDLSVVGGGGGGGRARAGGGGGGGRAVGGGGGVGLGSWREDFRPAHGPLYALSAASISDHGI
jgi:hypothetical protein